MTENELKQRFEKLDNEFQTKKMEIINEYVMSNNPYSIGDIVSDNTTTIRITKITPTNTFSGYQALYDGVVLDKKLQPKINKKTNKEMVFYVFQKNII